MENTTRGLYFQINGLCPPVLTDGGTMQFTVTPDGPAEQIRFRLFDGERIVWDSGALPWSGPNYCFDGLPLKARSVYRAEVIVTAGGAVENAVGRLETGVMGQWHSQWVEPEQENAVPERPLTLMDLINPTPDHFGNHGRLRPAQELRRVFTLKEVPARAALYASAHGVYALWVNGKRADARRLAPETAPYQYMLYYQVYDLTGLLRVGENTLRILLADGWWIGRIGGSGDSCQYGDRLGFIMELDVYDGAGGMERICSDAQMEGRVSNIDYADLYMGEKRDLTKAPGPWTPCTEATYDTELLTLQTIPPVAPWTELEAVSLDYTPNGELVADFGQCLAGVVRLELACPAGREVTLDHTEVLDTEGNFFRNILGRNKDQEDRVVCGEGVTVFEPEFTYHGFRYVRLTGAAKEEVRSIKAVALGTPLEERGRFACSDPRLNQLQHNIRWSTRSNMVSVPTDCPQREKQGWTGDILAFAGTGCFNYDLRSFLAAWLAQMRREQTEDGGIPIVIPSFPAQTRLQEQMAGCNTASAWSDACVLVPLEVYRAYGDKQVLVENLPMMERWLAYVQRDTEVLPDDYDSRDEAGKARCRYLWTGGYHFGDWLIPSQDVMAGRAATARVIGGFQYAVLVKAFLEVLEALDEPEARLEEYRELLANIQKAAREEFIGENGRIAVDLQGMYVMALYSGAAGPLSGKVAKRLVELIGENGGCLDTGFVSVPHLLDALTDNGYEDIAWKLLFQTKNPSWLYQVEHGATTIWENWNAIRPDGEVTVSSYNHYALGCVGDWIYRHAGGLRRTSPGWSTIEYAPNVDCGLDWAECSYDTPYGAAACSWRKTERGTELELTVPWGVQATLRLNGRERELTPGTHKIIAGRERP